MTLEIPEPPEKSRQEAIEGLRRARKEKLSADAQSGTLPVLSDPHQVFTIDPRAIISGTGLETATPVGWRYLVGSTEGISSGASPTSPLAIAEVAEQNGLHRFSHRQEGWLAKQTKQTIDIAMKLPELVSGAYELRLLRLPSICHIDALWLKNRGAGTDLVIPIASTSPDIVAGRTYAAEDFLNIVRVLATQLSFDNSPESSQR